MKLCMKCGVVPLKSKHEWYCPECRELAKKESRERDNEKRKAARKGFAYRFKKPEEIEGAIPKARRTLTSPASKRWARMSWTDLTKELLHYKMSYPESQLRAEKNTLPEDFGLKKKRDRV